MPDTSAARWNPDSDVPSGETPLASPVQMASVRLCSGSQRVVLLDDAGAVAVVAVALGEPARRALDDGLSISSPSSRSVISEMCVLRVREPGGPPPTEARSARLEARLEGRRHLVVRRDAVDGALGHRRRGELGLCVDDR